MRQYIIDHVNNTYILALLLHPNITATWDVCRWKKQMCAGGHQLWPVSQVTTLAIVTSRLKPHVYIPRSCSGSAGSCPFTFTPTNELGAKHNVITPIWLGTSRRTGKWSACLPIQGYSNKGHDLPLSSTDLSDRDDCILLCHTNLIYLLSCSFISSKNNSKPHNNAHSLKTHI